MTKAFSSSTTIQRPADEVWAALTDWGSAHRWMGQVEHIEADGDTEPGTTLTFRARGKDRQSTVEAVEPGRSVVLRSMQGGVTADYRYSVAPIDDGSSSASLTAECHTSGLWSAVGPALRFAMRRADGDQLDRLRQVLESG